MDKKTFLELSLMTEVASMYYERHLTQEEIGKLLFISRPRVSRILKKAEDTGIVEIKVKHTLNRAYYLEERLCSRYNMNKIIVYNAVGRTPVEAKRGVCELAAAYLQEAITHSVVIGLSWGSTVAQAVDLIAHPPSIPIDVVQIMGAAATTNAQNNGENIAHKFAGKFGGTVYSLNAPLFVEREVRECLERDPIISQTLSIAAKADMILTSVGTLDVKSFSNPWIGYITKDMFDELTAQGAVGCIGARFYNAEGAEIKKFGNMECVGIDLAKVRKCPDVVAVASGANKTKAILGALNGRLIDTLIIDSVIADALLE